MQTGIHARVHDVLEQVNDVVSELLRAEAAEKVHRFGRCAHGPQTSQQSNRRPADVASSVDATTAQLRQTAQRCGLRRGQDRSNPESEVRRQRLWSSGAASNIPTFLATVVGGNSTPEGFSWQPATASPILHHGRPGPFR